jgi:inorganic pyrophosphatase/exopolyphosphatase
MADTAGLQVYLASIKSTLDSLGECDHVSVTIGNESCDLDSIVCALCHAHHLAQHANQPSLPLLHCSRADFTLRTDAVWLFGYLGLDPTHLLFWNEAVEALQAVRRVSVTLVDHAHPTGPLLELPNMEVVAVIDHHPGISPTVGQEWVMELVGSCASLVAETLLEDDSYTMHREMATLLLGAILLDTVGLDATAGRLTDKDQAMAERLGQLAGADPVQLYSSLSAARLSTAGLTAHQLLRKDLKCATAGAHCLGFSSVTCPLSSELLGREEMEEAVSTLCQARELSALVVLGVSVGAASMSREIAIFQPEGSDLADTVAGVLESDQQLECRRAPSATSCILLSQGNPQLSRKYTLPLVVDFINTLTSEEMNEEGNVQSGATPPSCHTGLAADQPVTDKQESTVADRIPEYTYKEEIQDTRSHRLVAISQEQQRVLAMDVVQPFRKIIQHGGYVGPERHAVLVISACYLPPRSLPHYDHTVDHLFLYVMSVVQRLVVDDYLIVYLHSGAPRHSMPSISILRKFYQTVDHRCVLMASTHSHNFHPQAQKTTKAALYSASHFLGTLHAPTGTPICKLQVLS